MKIRIVLLLLLSANSYSFAQTDVFSFKDVKGFEKCLRTDHVVDVIKKPGSEQGRFIQQGEIQERCIDNAVTLLKSAKAKKETFLEYIEATKRNSAHERALELIDAAVRANRSECNNIKIYEVLTKSLSHPKDYPVATDSYFSKTHSIAKECLKDKEFKSDFTEEKDSENSYLSANACAILRDEKIVKDCK